eukprot:CAMPEP_0116105608 /NCGR_PEP_ID=MMETSP0327-20121206/15135_1 /TAXON_ID=44447 /ORGANISM="Pseudo-nitzschia delicatissima, Strain B596" /LENGTH=579 /DNA_ID=CAMNT_0003598049 /DNA_START=69 /DNA_END=1809 /DNA_ORIENTATION=+
MTAWNLCLQSRQGRKVISLDSKASTKELYESTAKEFGCGIERLKAGFPPKPIPSDSTPIGNFVSNQERIQVEFAASSSSSPKKGKKNGQEKHDNNNNTTSTSNNDTSRRSKRAASKAATESMPALIKAQEEYMKQNAPPAGKKRARSTNNGIHGIFPNRTKSSPKSKRLPASAGAGRRLNDGATVANPSRRKRQSDPNSGGDMSTALMGVIHDKGQMGIILRRGMKNAVLSSYETTKSFSRLAAIQAKSYTMNNTGSLLQISYKGSVDKTKVEEQVDCIPKDVLQAVLEGIHASNQEALRPENLSKLSPRVLWSCVHYFPNLDSLAAIYRALLPDLDWGFLRRRAEQLSEKALENKRQLGEEEDDDDDDLDLERASNVVAAVEHAMEHLQDFASVERKAKQAQAAEARLRRLQNTYSTWKLVTPSEPDRDELRECIEVALPEKASAAQITKWISQLMAHKIHNWRELALASSKVDILADKLNVPVSNIRLWIDKAQSESVPEIMVKICDNNVQAVELLAEHAKSGTPKDLSGWRSIPDMLLEQLPQTQRMDLGTLSTWCDRAHALLQEYEWLNWYATPV